MKKIVALFLALVLLTLLSVSAYATENFLLAEAGESGVLLHDTTVFQENGDGTRTQYIYPETSTVTLFYNLYSGDYYAVGSIYHASLGRQEEVYIPASAIYFFPDHVRGIFDEIIA